MSLIYKICADDNTIYDCVRDQNIQKYVIVFAIIKTLIADCFADTKNQFFCNILSTIALKAAGFSACSQCPTPSIMCALAFGK